MADPEHTAEELFKAGDLSGAIEAETRTVRKSPVDLDARYRLFVFLCYAGELERADKQLAVLAEQDERAAQGSLVYHALLSAEVERRRVYEGSARPTLPPDAPAFALRRVEALERLRAGDLEGAARHVDQAVESTPPCPGKLGGEAFTDWRDYDDVLGSTLEIFAGGRYIWMPLTRIKRVELEAPRTAVDALWRPARIEGTDGVTADVHLPALYARSYAEEHDAIRLGRVTDWREQGDLYTGVGQHLFLSIRGDERIETSLMDVRHLEFDVAG
jgi:type VI secretion system protein ImpE